MISTKNHRPAAQQPTSLINIAREAFSMLLAGLGAVGDMYNDEIDKVQRELGVSRACAFDVVYLRGRPVHTPELEHELILAYEQGKDVNIFKWIEQQSQTTAH